jgi:phosphate uptake regulator
LKQVFDYIHKVLFLAYEVQQNRDELDELRRSVERLAETVRQQSFEIQRICEREQHEREKFALKVENALLRFERQLPPGKDPKKLK